MVVIPPCVSDCPFHTSLHQSVYRDGTGEGGYSTYAVDPIVAVAVEAVVENVVAAANLHLTEQARSHG